MSNCDKKQYSKVKAQTVLNKLINSGKWNRKSAKGRIYPCPYCNFWHITSSIDDKITSLGSKFRIEPLKHTDKWNELINKD